MKKKLNQVNMIRHEKLIRITPGCVQIKKIMRHGERQFEIMIMHKNGTTTHQVNVTRYGRDETTKN